MSGFEATTYGAVVAATPRLMLAPKPSVCSFAITVAVSVDGDPPGFTVTTSSSTCGPSDSRQGSGSGSPGVQITIAALVTAAPGRPRACGEPSPPTSSGRHARGRRRAGAP